MAELKKAQKAMELLKQQMLLRMPTRVQTDSVDANGFPVLLLSDSTPAVGEDNILIKIRTIVADWQPKDALGLDQRVYTPHVAEILLQKNATTTITSTPATIAQVQTEIARMGLGARLLAQADATNAVVAESQIAAAVLLADIRDPQFPLIGEM